MNDLAEGMRDDCGRLAFRNPELDRVIAELMKRLRRMSLRPSRNLWSGFGVSLLMRRSFLRPRSSVILPNREGGRPVLVAGFLYFVVMVSLPRK